MLKQSIATSEYPRPELASLLVASVLLVLTSRALAESSQDLLERYRQERVARIMKVEEAARTAATIDATAIGAPIGRFLLMRKGNAVCAIRFTKFHRGGDSRPQTSFRTNEESLYAEYDWFYLSGNEVGQSTNSGSANVSYRPTVGYGHLRIQRGNTSVKCGSMQATWGYPNSVGLIETSGAYRSNGIDLSPTGWSNIEQVRPDDSKIVWYKYDDTRKSIHVPLKDLPGAETTKP